MSAIVCCGLQLGVVCTIHHFDISFAFASSFSALVRCQNGDERSLPKTIGMFVSVWHFKQQGHFKATDANALLTRSMAGLWDLKQKSRSHIYLMRSGRFYARAVQLFDEPDKFAAFLAVDTIAPPSDSPLTPTFSTALTCKDFRPSPCASAVTPPPLTPHPTRTPPQTTTSSHTACASIIIITHMPRLLSHCMRMLPSLFMHIQTCRYLPAYAYAYQNVHVMCV